MISVLIPSYNSASYIGEALESVLRQTRKDFEIVVVDDGSTDETRRIVESYRSFDVKYFYQENAGIGAARNRCVELAAREFFAFLDADDVWLPNKLELQMRAFETDDSLEAVFGMVKQISQTDWKREIGEQIFSAEKELFKGYAAGTMLIKRQSFERVGKFPQTQTVGEFIDWFLRAKELDLTMKLMPDLMLLRRIHQSNTMIRQRRTVQDYAKILKSSIDRRRLNKSAPSTEIK